MQVTCSHCNTSFNLPDEKAKIGAKLRCSQCKEVFRLEDPNAAPKPKPAEKPAENTNPGAALEMEVGKDGSIQMEGFGFKSKKKKIDLSSKKVKIALVAVVLLIVGGAGASMFLGGSEEIVPPPPVASSDLTLAEALPQAPPSVESVNMPPPLTGQPGQGAQPQIAPPLTQPLGGNPFQGVDGDVQLMELRNVRQYTVNNEKIGKISVIEGVVINGFNTPRELVKIEAILYGSSGNVIISKTQLAGTSVSLFQLQVLGREELEQALANNIDVLTNNSNIQPEGRVPFMLIFYNPPQDASEFGVKVVDVKLVGK